MPRVARIVIPGLPHHITQRGNNRQDVFFVSDDRRVYLTLLREESARHGLGVLGYCLMGNHVHMVGVPAREESLAKAVGRTHWRYTQYVNRLHGRVGHLWQNRFYSCAMDEAHTVAAMRYVERNPVRGGVVRRAWRYEWSSARAHVGQAHGSGLLDVEEWGRMWPAERWRGMLLGPEDEIVVADVRRSALRGRPLAGDALLAKVERRLGRRLRPLPIGRPRKARKNR